MIEKLSNEVGDDTDFGMKSERDLWVYDIMSDETGVSLHHYWGCKENTTDPRYIRARTCQHCNKRLNDLAPMLEGESGSVGPEIVHQWDITPPGTLCGSPVKLGEYLSCNLSGSSVTCPACLAAMEAKEEPREATIKTPANVIYLTNREEAPPTPDGCVLVGVQQFSGTGRAYYYAQQTVAQQRGITDSDHSGPWPLPEPDVKAPPDGSVDELIARQQRKPRGIPMELGREHMMAISRLRGCP